MYYIGTKFVTAEPEEKDGKPGYTICYPDGYVSWCPKEVFEKWYLPIELDPMKKEPTPLVTTEMISDFITDTQDCCLTKQSYVLVATLRNGMEIAESATLSHGEFFRPNPGHQITRNGIRLACMGEIKSKVSDYLYFLARTAFNGV